MVTGSGNAYDLYLYVFDVSGNTKYLDFMDDDEATQNYMKCTVTGFNFEVASDGIWRGTVQVQEIWT